MPVASRLSRQDWLLLIIAAPIIAILSLGAHDLAIAYLGIPYPSGQPPVWVNAVGQAARVAGALLLYRCAEGLFRSRSLLSAALTIGLLLVFLQETLRVICVEIALVEGWVDGRWIYILVNHLPGLILPLIQAALIGRFSTHRKRVLAIFLVCAAGAVLAFSISPGLQSIPRAIFSRFSMEEPQELYQMPYDWHIYRVIYATFIEPTIACFCLAVLVWPGLRGSPVSKVAQFAALILLVRGRVVGLVLNTFWIDQPYPMALLSFGQFFVETLILASLTGLVWAYVQRKAR